MFLGKVGECIKSLGCQIREDYGHYRQLEFEESVREQREKERWDCVGGVVADRWSTEE